jgi:hypothetical protein
VSGIVLRSTLKVPVHQNRRTFETTGTWNAVFRHHRLLRRRSTERPTKTRKNLNKNRLRRYDSENRKLIVLSCSWLEVIRLSLVASQRKLSVLIRLEVIKLCELLSIDFFSSTRDVLDSFFSFLGKMSRPYARCRYYVAIVTTVVFGIRDVAVCVSRGWNRFGSQLPARHRVVHFI